MKIGKKYDLASLRMTGWSEGDVSCECGEALGEPCQWHGPASETVIVEYMPEFLRASHEAAGNCGMYPENGAIRFRAERSCAETIIESAGDWARIVG